MNSRYLERWAANVSAWAAIGLLIGGIASCSFPKWHDHFELISTIGGAAGALLGMILLSLPREPEHTDRRRQMIPALNRANRLFLRNQINLYEYRMMRGASIQRYS
jgi:hypothetical protein